MATSSNVPTRVPEPQREPVENSAARPADWRQDKKPTRFVIKVGGIIPS